MASPFVRAAHAKLLPVADLTGQITLEIVDVHDSWCECWLCAEADAERKYDAGYNALAVSNDPA